MVTGIMLKKNVDDLIEMDLNVVIKMMIRMVQ